MSVRTHLESLGKGFKKNLTPDLFHGILAGLFRLHPGEVVLVVHRGMAPPRSGYTECETPCKKVYLGIIRKEFHTLVYPTGKAFFPTIGYAVSTDCSATNFDISGGDIQEIVFGGGSIFSLFHSRAPSGNEYALEIFIGNDAAWEWFSHESRVGRFPFLFSSMKGSLEKAFHENRCLQFA